VGFLKGTREALGASRTIALGDFSLWIREKIRYDLGGIVALFCNNTDKIPIYVILFPNVLESGLKIIDSRLHFIRKYVFSLQEYRGIVPNNPKSGTP